MMSRPVFTDPGIKVPGIEHGTLTSYTTHKCRCLDCRTANREYHSARRKREQQALLDRIAELEALVIAK